MFLSLNIIYICQIIKIVQKNILLGVKNINVISSLANIGNIRLPAYRTCRNNAWPNYEESTVPRGIKTKNVIVTWLPYSKKYNNKCLKFFEFQTIFPLHFK